MPHLPLGIVLALAVGATTSVGAIALTEDRSPSTITNSEILLSEQPTALSVGQFVAVEHPTQGQINIIEEDGKRYLEFGSDFQTDEGPDLKVILHNADMVDLKVQEGSYVSLGALTSFSGSQRYLIPEDVDLDRYQSVAIWCQQFNATFGYAPIAQTLEN